MNSTPEHLDLNEQFILAHKLLEQTSKNIFITGKAGTGKSTLLQYFRNNTKKNIAILAPTGVAAVNIQGQTIHSFFNFKPDVTPESASNIRVSKSKKLIYQKLDMIVIDEISMVRADLLDCIDAFLRRHGKERGAGFGGIQMVFIGDLYQLPPVVPSREQEIFKTLYPSPYFFDARAFANLQMDFLELEKIYRQKDNEFIELLNAIRNNSLTDEHVAKLNKRHLPQFQPRDDEFYIYLTTTNDLADQINQERLKMLKTRSYTYDGYIDGEFELKNLPTHLDLELKEGAQVMMLNNDAGGRWINGSIGKITAIKRQIGATDAIEVELANGRRVDVIPHTWEMFHFSFNEETQALESESTGAFTQYPLRLAWAVTIHKSQGKTFSKIIVDMGRGAFSHGQVYVALSRCTSLEGLILKKPILKKHIFMNWHIIRFLTNYQYKKSEESCSLEEKKTILKKAALERQQIDLIYLKATDEKSRRTIIPKRVGQMEYQGKKYWGVEGFCLTRKEDRIFRLDRILELKSLKEHKTVDDV